MRIRRILIAVGLALCLAPLAGAETIRVVGFNVESGGADPATIAQQLGALGPVDIWGFSEVTGFSWALQFKAAVMTATDQPYWFIFGNSGGEDRLVLLYNQDKFEELGHEELDSLNPQGRVRAPLVAHLRVKGTGQEFLAMVNHLYRGNAQARHQQARQLQEWAEAQTLPVIAVGDYNFDWLSDSNHDQGFDELTRDGVFTWVRPGNLLDAGGTLLPTQCHPDFRSVLDFVFVSGEARSWSATSEILFGEADYCPDSNLTSDHRPVEATFTLPAGPPPPPGETDRLAELRIAVEALEQALEEVKARLAALEDD